METYQLSDIVNKFAISGTVSDIQPLGDGLINTTFKVTTAESDADDYVLQSINTAIFPDVDTLMNNIVAVTSHIRRKLAAANQSDINRHCCRFIPLKTDADKYYYFDGQKHWRIMLFIRDSVTKNEVNPQTSFEVGIAFGNFESMLADIPDHLGDTIKDFHNMEFRLSQLRDAVAQDLAHRAESVSYYIEQLLHRADDMTLGERLFRQGKLPKRICHCDTKVNNILFDRQGNILCVIDLDTVMPNFVFSDFGDFLRSAANTGLEDDKNLDNVSFNMEIFKAFSRGYIQSAGSMLTPIEIENLPFAAALFPYMQTVRFLADYINGDTYYKTLYPEHNLVRTKAQFKLLQSVEQHYDEMNNFIASLAKKGTDYLL